MKLIKCIIRLERLLDVIEALAPVVSGLTVYEVRGHGRQSGHTAVYRGTEYTVALLPKMMIETVVDDSRADDIAKIVREAAIGRHSRGTMPLARVAIMQTGRVSAEEAIVTAATAMMRFNTHSIPHGDFVHRLAKGHDRPSPLMSGGKCAIW